MISENVLNSFHQRETTDKDNNNNSTVQAVKYKQKTTERIAQKSNENIVPYMDGVLKEKKNVKITDPKYDPSCGVQTLKRKRDAKSPSAKVTESPSSDATSRKQSQTTATILVSKTKTKTGLPLLMKK